MGTKRVIRKPRWGMIIGLTSLCVALIISGIVLYRTISTGNILGKSYYNDLETERISENSPQNIHIEYPRTGNETVNAFIKNFIDTKYSDFKKTLNADIENAEFNISYESSVFNEDIVSFYFSTYAIQPGMAHGDRGIDTFTFDMKSGKCVTLNELFVDQKYHEKFLKQLQEKVTDIVSEDSDNPYLSTDEVIRVVKDTKHFTISHNSLFAYFEPYQIAPGYKATQIISISLSDVQGLKLEQIEKVAQNITVQNFAESQFYKEQHRRFVKSYEGKKLIALTFDDGPHQTLTPQLLDILKQKDTEATFFVLGSQVKKNPEIVRRAYAEGHAIGSHTYSHYNLVNLTPEEVASEFERTNEQILLATGESPIMMRPPYGSFNDEIAQNANAAIILWSVDTQDWNGLDAKTIVDNVVSDSKDGSIVLMHDIHKASIEAVPVIIDALHEEGYTLVSVETLLEVRGGLENGEAYYAAYE
ncbi:polysaccharide deacetylase family protein [Erysipelothrix sp. HDW6C]|uniref:polysaccharide deacetylase family protein n=1 Tax=Erysipelothrix sp. HDW6C TaxID=2714930 RepID=UPI00140CE511|nr:polysaccharide deacetylase family protein [Erysipelothrix sp. HDW6C]QIK69439.1 polysaccharide deacetylase family protein [Erysipelothrix sp. HDW6C]